MLLKELGVDRVIDYRSEDIKTVRFRKPFLIFHYTFEFYCFPSAKLKLKGQLCL